jgi:hypothetical protein
MRLCVLNQPTPNKLINKCNILLFASRFGCCCLLSPSQVSHRRWRRGSSTLARMSNVRLEAVIKLLISNSCNYNCAISPCRGGKKRGENSNFDPRGLEGRSGCREAERIITPSRVFRAISHRSREGKMRKEEKESKLCFI